MTVNNAPKPGMINRPRLSIISTLRETKSSENSLKLIRIFQEHHYCGVLRNLDNTCHDFCGFGFSHLFYKLDIYFLHRILREKTNLTKFHII